MIATAADSQARVAQLIRESHARLLELDFEGSLRRLEEAHRVAPADDTVVALLAKALASQNRTREAVKLLERVLKARPDQPKLLLEAAGLQWKLGRSAEAERNVRRVLTFEPSNLTALRLLMELALARPDFATAAECARKVLAVRPREAVAQTALGRALAGLEQWGAARDALEVAVELDPSNGTTRDLLREVTVKADQAAAAEPPQADPAFAAFFRAAAQSERLPAVAWRLAWLEFRRLFSELIQGAVWSARPRRREEWLLSVVARERFSRLAEALGGLLPVEQLPRMLSLPDAFELLEGVHACIVDGLKAGVPHVRRVALSTGRAVPADLPDDFPRRSQVAQLRVALEQAPESIPATLLHGSLADGLTAGGYSDADVLCVVAAPGAEPGTFWSAAQWLFDLNHELYAVNPCMHHGPMVAFASEFEMGAEASVPSAIIQHGVWCKGGYGTIHYHDGVIEAVAAVAGFEFYFERTHLFASQLRSAFDVLWWTSSVLFLPLCWHQAEHGRSIYKRICLDQRAVTLSAEAWSAIEQSAQVRLALGRWLSERLCAPPPSADRAVNPGCELQAQRERLKLSPGEVRALGVTDDLCEGVRRLWEEVRARVLAAGFAAIGSEATVPAIEWQLPFSLAGEPRRLEPADYERAREQFLARCRENPDVCAVFEFGEVGCPGLSDLDFCVVLRDEARGVPAELRVSAFAEDVAYAMDHDPLFVARSNVGLVGAVFPIFQVRQLAGESLAFPISAEFPGEVVRAAMTTKLLKKYPGDLDYFMSQPELDVRSVLAVAHSFSHVRRCFETMGIAVPSEVDRVAELDREVRDAFRAGRAPGQQVVWRTIEWGLAAARPIREALARHWAVILQAQPENELARIPAAADAAAWLADQLADPLGHGPRDGAPRVGGAIARYVDLRRQFSALERARGREPSSYIEPPSVGGAAGIRPLSVEVNPRVSTGDDSCWLLAKTDALGDQMMISGLVHEMAQQLAATPAGRLVWIVREGIEAIQALLDGAQVWRANPRLDPRGEARRLRRQLAEPVTTALERVFLVPAGVRPYPASEAVGQLAVAEWWIDFVEELAPGRAIAGSPNVNWFDQLLVRGSRAPRRCGVVGSPDTPPLPGAVLLSGDVELFNEPVKFRAGRKEFEHLAELGARVLGRSGPDRPWLRPVSVPEDATESVGLIVAVGAGDRRRALPASTVAEAVADFLRSAEGADFGSCVVLEGPSDRVDTLEVAAALRARGVSFRVVRCGGDALATAAAWMRRSRLVFCNETGSAHLALALGVPTVIAWGLGHWPRYVPAAGSGTIVRAEMECAACNWFCRYASWRCVDALPARAVADALRARAAVGADGVLSESVVVGS